MIRFKTLKALAEYAIETSRRPVDQHDTVEVYITQGLVKMSESKRQDLIKDGSKLYDYVQSLLDKYRQDNVVNIFSRVSLDADKSIKNSYFDTITEKNLKNKKRLADTRNKENRSVLRSYRIKG